MDLSSFNYGTVHCDFPGLVFAGYYNSTTQYTSYSTDDESERRKMSYKAHNSVNVHRRPFFVAFYHMIVSSCPVIKAGIGYDKQGLLGSFSSPKEPHRVEMS